MKHRDIYELYLSFSGFCDNKKAKSIIELLDPQELLKMGDFYTHIYNPREIVFIPRDGWVDKTIGFVFGENHKNAGYSVYRPVFKRKIG